MSVIGHRLVNVVPGAVSNVLRRALAVALDELEPQHIEDIHTWAKAERVKWYPGCGR